MAFKRVLGTANLYLRGRRHDFDRGVQQALVAHIQALEPDLVLITGDLTAQSLEAEFEQAHQDLQPLLEAIPTFMVPGNHDVYTGGAARHRPMERWFAPYMGLDGSGIGRCELGPLTVLGLDPNRATWTTASGVLPQRQLDALAEALAQPGEGPILLALHYPVIDRHGALYVRPSHGLLNAQQLVDVLEAAPRRPALIACGHIHHGFRADLELSDGTRIPVCDCGTSGQAHRPDHGRAAAMGLYELHDDGTVELQRYLHDGQAFVPEPGGAWATGR